MNVIITTKVKLKHGLRCKMWIGVLSSKHLEQTSNLKRKLMYMYSTYTN